MPRKDSPNSQMPLTLGYSERRSSCEANRAPKDDSFPHGGAKRNAFISLTPYTRPHDMGAISPSDQNRNASGFTLRVRTDTVHQFLSPRRT